MGNIRSFISRVIPFIEQKALPFVQNRLVPGLLRGAETASRLAQTVAPLAALGNGRGQGRGRGIPPGEGWMGQQQRQGRQYASSLAFGRGLGEGNGSNSRVGGQVLTASDLKNQKRARYQ